MGFLLDPHGFNPSPFEARISAEGPIFHARFRDGDFTSVIADSSGNNRNLVKQIAAATRSAVPTRTTHPGGALFPSVTYDNWGTQGTFYKRAAESLLSGATEYTALISFRVVKAPNAHIGKAFGLGTENVAESGTNDLAFMKVSNNAPTNPHWWKHRTNSLGLSPADFAVTEKIEDGVNRLATARYVAGGIYRLTTSKPGHELLVEENAGSAGTGLQALSRALILNARSETGTGSNTTLEMVVDQIALFDTDIGATAEADLHSKWMDEVAGAGYYPSMMQFDGSTGYYSLSNVTTSGNKFSAVLRFNIAASAGGGIRRLFVVQPGGGAADTRVFLDIGDSEHAVPEWRDRIRMLVKAADESVPCRLYSDVVVADGEDHCIFVDFDGDAGTATFVIDGDSAINAGATNHIAPTAAILAANSTTDVTVGSNIGGSNLSDGEIGCVGYADVGGLDPADFMDGNLPKPIDEKDWTEFGGTQPAFWAHDGALENNKGSAGDMTLNGGVTRTTGGSP